MKRNHFFLCLTLLFSLTLSAAPAVKATPGNKDSIYRNGEYVVFNFQVTEDDKPKKGYLYCIVEREGFLPRKDKLFETDENGKFELRLSPGKPGNIRVQAVLCGADGKIVTVPDRKGKPRKVACGIGAMVDPEKLSSPFAEPADFDVFWDRARKELSSVPMKVEAKREIKVPENIQGKAKAFDLKISVPGPRPVSGILTMPADAEPGSLPAVLLVHGAGVRSSIVRPQAAEWNAILFDVNAHGIENHKPARFYSDLDKGELNSYLLRIGKEDPENGYFRYMFLRGLRALEYLRSLPEWDGKTLIVSGGSQGGAQALILAGLDPSVSFCRANIPWLTVPAAPAAGCFQPPAWARLIQLDKEHNVLNPEAIERLGYFDAANHARRMKAECSINYGMIDDICPPSGVWMTYLNIPSTKRLYGVPTKAHQNIPDGDTIPAYLKRIGKM